MKTLLWVVSASTLVWVLVGDGLAQQDVDHRANGCWWCEIGADYGRATFIFKSYILHTTEAGIISNLTVRGIGTVAASLYPQGFSGTWEPVSSNSFRVSMTWYGGDIPTPQGTFTATLLTADDLVINTGGPSFVCVRADQPATDLRGKWTFKGRTAEAKVKGKVILDPYYNQPDEYPYVWDGSDKRQTSVFVFCGPGDDDLWLVGNYQNAHRFRARGAFTASKMSLLGWDADDLALIIAAKFKPPKP